MATTSSKYIPPDERSICEKDEHATWEEIMNFAYHVFKPENLPPDDEDVDLIIDMLADLAPDDREPPKWVDMRWFAKNISTFGPGGLNLRHDPPSAFVNLSRWVSSTLVRGTCAVLLKMDGALRWMSRNSLAGLALWPTVSLGMSLLAEAERGARFHFLPSRALLSLQPIDAKNQNLTIIVTGFPVPRMNITAIPISLLVWHLHTRNWVPPKVQYEQAEWENYENTDGVILDRPPEG